MKFLNLTLIVTSIFTFSCKNQITCSQSDAVSLIQEGVRTDLIESFALKLAADDFVDDASKKDYQGQRHGWLNDISRTYETYLKNKLSEIKMQEGHYFEMAERQYMNNQISLQNIVTENYDETVDKCGCSASIIFTNSDAIHPIQYNVAKNSEGNITVTYVYRPETMLDERNNSSDFIKNN